MGVLDIPRTRIIRVAFREPSINPKPLESNGLIYDPRQLSGEVRCSVMELEGLKYYYGEVFGGGHRVDVADVETQQDIRELGANLWRDTGIDLLFCSSSGVYQTFRTQPLQTQRLISVLRGDISKYFLSKLPVKFINSEFVDVPAER